MRKKITKSKNKIRLGGKDIGYTLYTSSRQKYMRLSVRCDGALTVSRPRYINKKTVEKYIIEKKDWILKSLEKFQKAGFMPYKKDRPRYLKYKNHSYDFIKKRLDYFNRIYNLKYNKISVRDQKSRFGSCSQKANLNFNYKILFLPKEQADYIIVHELCHLKEFNHSKNFWRLVEKAVPNHLEIRKKLRKKGLNYY